MKMIKTGSTERIIKREKDRIIKECEGKEIQRKKYNKTLAVSNREEN